MSTLPPGVRAPGAASHDATLPPPTRAPAPVAPPREASAAPAPMAATAEQLARLVADIQNAIKQLGELRNGEQFLNTLTNSLATYPPFQGLIRSMVIELMTTPGAAPANTADQLTAHLDHVVSSLADGAVAPSTEVTAPSDGLYHAKLATQYSGQILKVSLLSSGHPTNPNGVETYMDTAPEGHGHQHWEPMALEPAAEAIVRQELQVLGAGPGDYYFLDLSVYSSRPLNAESVQVR